MARKTVKRTTLFTLIAVIALLGLGVGYAAWTAQLTVGSTVKTGTASMEFVSGPTAVENEIASFGDAAQCAASRTTDTNINWSVTNAYPGYSCTITFKSHNNGTVPLQVLSKVNTPTLVYSGTGAVFTVSGVAGVTLDFAACPVPLNDGDVVAAGSTGTCAFTIAFDDDLATGQTYTGSTTIDFVLP